MDSEHEEAEQKRLGEPAHPDASQSEDDFWEELRLPDEDAVPSEPAWFAALFEQTPLPPEPEEVSESAWIMDISDEVPAPPEPPWYERYWIDDAEEWEDSPGPIHPSGRWQILYILGWYDDWRQGHAVVCNIETKKWVWIPDEAREIAWSPYGREVAVIRERRYKPWLAFERYTWPERKQISACPIHMPIGWPGYLAISPRKDIAVFLWQDQGEAGLEFIALSEEGDYQIRNTGLPKMLDPNWRAFDVVNRSGGFPVMHSRPTNPAFSPSGRFIALGLDGERKHLQGHYVTPALGKLYQLGELFVLDWDKRKVRRIIVTDETPGQYNPRVEGDPSRFLEVAFLDEEHVALKLADGRVKFYHIYTDSSLVR